MNNALRASARTVSKGTIYRIAGSIGPLSAAFGSVVAAYVQPDLGTVFGYVAVPLLLTLLGWALVGILRLRLVGFLPSDADHLVPAGLKPWIRWWLLVRFGLLSGGLLLIPAIVVAAVAGVGVASFVHALVYLAILLMFLDLVFGTALNAGIITRRASAR